MKIINSTVLNASLNFTDTSVYIFRENDNLILGDIFAGKRTLSELVNDPSIYATVKYVDGSLSTFISNHGIYGFVQTNNSGASSISFDQSTYTFTLIKNSTLQYYRQGKLCSIDSSKSVTLPGSPPSKNNYYIYIDDTSGNLTQSTTAWTLDENDTKVPVAIILWDASLNPPYQMMEERHSCLIPRRDHKYLHQTRGTQLISGGTVSGYTLSPAVPIPSDNTFGISQAVIADEDLYQTLSTLNDPNGTTDAVYTIFRRNAIGSWVWTSNSSMPYTYGTTYLQYDNAGTLTEAADNSWVNYYLLLTNFQGQARFSIITGQSNIITSKNDAFAESPLSLDLTGFPSLEVIVAYQITFGIKNTYTQTAGRCRIERVQKVNLPSNAYTTQPALGDHSILTNRNLQGQHSIGSIYGTEANRIPFQDSTNTYLTDSSYLKFDVSVLIVDGFLNLNKGTNNIAISSNSLRANSGQNNIAIGNFSLVDIISASDNIGIGYYALNKNIGSGNVALGNYTLKENTSGVGNVGVGHQVLSNQTSGTHNIGIGYQALNTNSTGSYNTALGSYSLYNSSNAGFNTAVGYKALFSTLNGANTAVGYQALLNSVAPAGQNVAIGYRAMLNSSSGYYNTVIGTNALYSNITGNQNVAVGHNALYNASTGSDNIAIGYNSLYNNYGSNNVAIGTYTLKNGLSSFANIAIGTNTLNALISGNYNTAIGASNLTNLISGSGNTALGYYCGASASTGSCNYNVLIGYQAGWNSLYSGNRNIAIGYNTVFPNTNGNDQLVIGAQDLIYGDINTKVLSIGTSTPASATRLTVSATGYNSGVNSIATYRGNSTLYAPFKSVLPYRPDGCTGIYENHYVMYDASDNFIAAIGATRRYNMYFGNSTFLNLDTLNATYNIAIGLGTSSPLGNITTGSYNIAIGHSQANNQTGSYNVGIGYLSLNGSSGSFNTGLGTYTLRNNTTGNDNIGIGYRAGEENRTGFGNVNVGSYAGQFQKDGSYNTFVGYQSGYNSTSSTSAHINNVYVGAYSGWDSYNSGYNTLVGTYSGYLIKSGTYNTLIGYQAGYNVNNGTYNVAIGAYAGYFSSGTSNKLYIHSSSEAVINPLIYGEFDNRIFRINGKLQIDTSGAYIDTLNSTGDLIFYDSSAGVRTLSELIGGGGVSQAYVDGSLASRDSSITNLYNTKANINAPDFTGGIEITGDTSVNGNIIINNTHWIYFGDPCTNGTWRMGVNASTFIIQMNENGTYNTKGTFS